MVIWSAFQDLTNSINFLKKFCKITASMLLLMSSISVCDSSWGLTGDWLFSWRLTTSVPHPDEETEMHPGKLRDWDQQNTMLVSVQELAQPVALSTLASVNSLHRVWTEKWEHWRNTYKCGNVPWSTVLIDPKWGDKWKMRPSSSSSSLLQTFLFLECKMLWILIPKSALWNWEILFEAFGYSININLISCWIDRMWVAYVFSYLENCNDIYCFAWTDNYFAPDLKHVKPTDG